MKITITSDEGKDTILELPVWVEGKHLYFFAGIELLAYKYLDVPWQIKVSRCHECGGCCMNLGEVSQQEFVKVTDGSCTMLIADGTKMVCSLGSARPFSCSAGVGLKNVEGCTEKFKEV